jgi:hypothetical protein
MKSPEPAAGTVSTESLAKLLMLSTDRIRQLARAGHIPRAGHGRFNLVAAVQGYVKFLKDDDHRASRSAAADELRRQKASEIERRMAREDRKIIDLDEAVGCLDDICGLMLSTLNSLPAMITRNPSERRRIEDIIYQAQSRLATKCAEKTKVLVTGQEDTVAEDDDQ